MVGVDNGTGERQRLIDARNAVAQDNLSVLAHQTQNLGTGEGGAHGVAVGASVRRQQKAAALIDVSEYFVQHVVSFSSAFCCASVTGQFWHRIRATGPVENEAREGGEAANSPLPRDG